jgi:opacity protein-like surface antigen
VGHSVGVLRLGACVALVAAYSIHPAAADDAFGPRSGCYFGIQGGVAESHSPWDYTNNSPYSAQGNAGPQLVPGQDFSQDRPVIGGQLGCNFALLGPWLGGIEAAFFGDPMDRRKNNYNDLGPYTEWVTTNVKSVSSVTGRLGFAIAPDWLVYAKGGFALGLISTSGATTAALPEFSWVATEWHPGWTVGAGVEYWLLPRVSLGVEYNYYQFETKDHSGHTSLIDTGPPVEPANPVNHRVGAEVQTLMARINFYDPFGYTPVMPAVAMDRWRPPGQFSSFVNTSTKYYSWTGTRGSNVFEPYFGKGSQLYVSTTIGVDYYLPSAVKVENRFKTGYVSAHQSTAGQGASYDGPVDSQISINATFLQFSSIRPQIGVAANLPTGTAYLPNNQRFARMDPDLVEVGSYGAGYNINPTAGFVMGINRTTAVSVSGGYAWQGAFIRESVDLNAQGGYGAFDVVRRVNPGDVFTANANMTTEIDKLVVLATFAYMSESKATIDGVASGRAGGRYTANLTATQTIDQRWAVVLNGSWSYQEKNEIVLPGGGFGTEPKNSNSNVVIGSIEPSYIATDTLKLAVNYSFLWRDENYYDQFEDRFIPAKIKHTAGASATWAFAPGALLEFRGSYSWIHQNDSAYLPVVLVPLSVAIIPPALTYNSWMASVTGSVRF